MGWSNFCTCKLKEFAQRDAWKSWRKISCHLYHRRISLSYFLASRPSVVAFAACQVCRSCTFCTWTEQQSTRESFRLDKSQSTRYWRTSHSSSARRLWELCTIRRGFCSDCETHPPPSLRTSKSCGVETSCSLSPVPGGKPHRCSPRDSFSPGTTWVNHHWCSWSYLIVLLDLTLMLELAAPH